MSTETFYSYIAGGGLCLLVYGGLCLFKFILVKKFSDKVTKTSNILDDIFLGLIKKTKNYFYLFVGLFAGSWCLELSGKQRTIVDKVFLIILIIQLALWANWIISFWIDNHLKHRSMKDVRIASTLNLINLGARAVVYGLAALIALNNLGVDITAFIAGLGIGGIAIALALKNIVSDLFASLTIVLDKPFVVGDFIVIGEFQGTIEQIGLKTTRLTSLSGEQLIFGNEDLLQSRIRNYQIMAERRVEQSIRVDYDTPLDKLKIIPGIMKSAVESQEKTRFERCHFMNYQEFSLEYILVYWVRSADYGVYANIAQAINFSIIEHFNNEGIHFAFPTRTLQIKRQDDFLPLASSPHDKFSQV